MGVVLLVFALPARNDACRRSRRPAPPVRVQRLARGSGSPPGQLRGSARAYAPTPARSASPLHDIKGSLRGPFNREESRENNLMMDRTGIG